jgi:hypothetical protein
MGMLRQIQQLSSHDSCGNKDVHEALSFIKANQSLVFSAYSYLNLLH